MKPTISRIWLGPDPMPPEYQEYGEKWKHLNPDWVVQDWEADSIFYTRWQNQEIIDDIIDRVGTLTVEAAVQIADVVSYELVSTFGGGLYVNVDIEPIRSIEYMYEYYGLKADQAFAGYEDHTSGRIVNSVLGGSHSHVVWRAVMDLVKNYYFKNPLAEMVLTTGPVPLTDTFNYYLKQDSLKHSIAVLPTNAFNKVHWSQIPLGGNADGLWEDDSGIIGIHGWGHRKTGRSNLVRRKSDN